MWLLWGMLFAFVPLARSQRYPADALGHQHAGGQHHQDYYEGYEDEGELPPTPGPRARMRRYGERAAGPQRRADVPGALKEILAGHLMGRPEPGISLKPEHDESLRKTAVPRTGRAPVPARSTKSSHETIWATFRTIPVNTRASGRRVADPKLHPGHVFEPRKPHGASAPAAPRRAPGDSRQHYGLANAAGTNWAQRDELPTAGEPGRESLADGAAAGAAAGPGDVAAGRTLLGTDSPTPDWDELEAIARSAGFSPPIDWRDPDVRNSLVALALAAGASVSAAGASALARPTHTTRAMEHNTKQPHMRSGDTTTAATTTTTDTTDTTTTSTTPAPAPRTTINLDLDALIAIVAKLADSYDYDLVAQKFNETMLNYSVPTCAAPTTTAATTTTTTTPAPQLFDVNATVIAKCFVCGMDEERVPAHARCADAFAGDFIPVIPVEASAKSHISSFRKYCRYMDIPNSAQDPAMPRSVYGRWTGGCSVRWADLSGVYTQRACRSRARAATGRHFASKRMAKLEMALNDVDNGCIVSPAASLLPLSRGVSLFARVHACVCTGNWCNAGPAPRAPAALALELAAAALVFHL